MRTRAFSRPGLSFGGSRSAASPRGRARLPRQRLRVLPQQPPDAYHFFLDAAGRPRPVLNRNQFGGTIGGAVVEDKFFFLATEDIF